MNALTPRQIDVWALIAKGCLSTDIALILGISTKTVEKHRADLYRRLDLHNVADITRAAIAHGVIEVVVLPPERRYRAEPPQETRLSLTPTPDSVTTTS